MLEIAALVFKNKLRIVKAPPIQKMHGTDEIVYLSLEKSGVHMTGQKIPLIPQQYLHLPIKLFFDPKHILLVSLHLLKTHSVFRIKVHRPVIAESEKAYTLFVRFLGILRHLPHGVFTTNGVIVQINQSNPFII